MKTVLALALFVALNSGLAWKGIIVHVTDSEQMTKKQCDEWHKKRGWSECGYNYIVQRDGKVNVARGDFKAGAHTKGVNREFLGVALVGFPNTATREQLLGFKSLKDDLEAKHGKLEIYPHYAFQRRICPGRKTWEAVASLVDEGQLKLG